MAAFDPATLDRWRALAIVDRDGATVGTVSEFYLDRETGHPTWALVSTGLFGATQTFVPLVNATELGDGLQVPYEKRHIKDAPQVDPHDELTPDEEAALFTHYGVDYRPSTEPAVEGSFEAAPGAPGSTGSAGSAGAVAPDTGSAGGSVPAEPGPVDPAGGAPGEDEPLGGVAAEPDPAVPAGGGPGSDEPGTTEPVDPPGAGAGQAEPAAERRYEESPGPDPDLSRPAPVEPGLPGSIPATPSGVTPTTFDVGGPAGPTRDVEGRDGSPPPDTQADQWPSASRDPAAGDPDHPSDGPGPVPATDEAAMTAGWAPGSFGEHEPADRPAGASDRWREAKLAAERDRVARAAAAQPEERSPLGRARRRLERLVTGGQEPADPAEDSPADHRDAAERARRERLGLDDDPRR